MTSLAQIMAMPMDAGPNDGFFGYDEAGNPIRRGALGGQYIVKPQASAESSRRRATNQALLSAAMAGRPFDPGAFDAQQSAPLGGAMRGLAQGVWQGIAAPGRAAAGEPMTMGDVWSTALDYGAVAAPAGKPAGALGAGGVKVFTAPGHPVNDTVMTGDLFKKAQEAADALRKRYGAGVEITTHPTSYGNSAYVKVVESSPDKRASASGGFRLSDHEVGDRRKATDGIPTIIDGDDISVDGLLSEVEAQIARGRSTFPEIKARQSAEDAARAAWQSLSHAEQKKYKKKAIQNRMPGGADVGAFSLFLKDYGAVNN